MPDLTDYVPHFASVLAVLDFLAILLTIPWILSLKKDSTSATAWCLVVLLLPLVGFVLFVVFGYNHVDRPIRRKRRHRVGFRVRNPEAKRGAPADRPPAERTYEDLGRLASRLGAFPVTDGNEVTLYHESQKAFDELFEAVRDARHHVHVEYFIIQPDETGRHFLDLLAKKAAEGVEVRLLFDAIGSRGLKSRMLRPLREKKGRCCAFLAINPLRRRIQVNMRNHRKIVVVDGRIAFTGGLNVGDEYLGKNPILGYWRDAHLRLEGPAVTDLQWVFAEDWDFAAGETLRGEAYFPEIPRVGDAVVQVISSGPDQEINSLRELVFAAISAARQRLWIASPYIVPDSGILDALKLAARLGVDVRLLVPLRPDHFLTYFAGRYLWADLLAEGIKVYEYDKGMMHSKFILVDGKWGTVGSANLDNRSLHLNFEANVILHSPELVAELEQAFLADLRLSIQVEPRAFAGRSFAARLIENACRLLSPVL